jgi:hypothetical protein
MCGLGASFLVYEFYCPLNTFHVPFQLNTCVLSLPDCAITNDYIVRSFIICTLHQILLEDEKIKNMTCLEEMRNGFKI